MWMFGWFDRTLLDAFETFHSLQSEDVNTHSQAPTHKLRVLTQSLTCLARSLVSRLMLESRGTNTHAVSGGRSTQWCIVLIKPNGSFPFLLYLNVTIDTS